MKIMISPAKKMKIRTDSFAPEGIPAFVEDAGILLSQIRSLSLAQAAQLWKCSGSLAKLNYGRFQQMDFEQALTPAVLAYEGLQYQHMAPEIFTKTQLSYIKEHLYILSGFYGLLRAFDGVTPYRLEMQAKLAVNGQKDLYGFWGRRIYEKLSEGGGVIVNLASKEYARCVEKYLSPQDRFLTAVFVELKDGKARQKGTAAKMARGEMVRFLAEQEAQEPERMKEFRGLGFAYAQELSDENTYVFAKRVDKQEMQC